MAIESTLRILECISFVPGSGALSEALTFMLDLTSSVYQ